MTDLQVGDDGKINTRSSMTGKIQRVTPEQYETFSTTLQIVPDDAKPYEPGLFKPGKVGEFDNPEPLTDAQEQAHAELDAVKEDSGAHSKAAKEARDAAKAADDEAAKNQAAADAANESKD